MCMQGGNVWEKAGVNVSVVYGSMPAEAYRAATTQRNGSGQAGSPSLPPVSSIADIFLAVEATHLCTCVPFQQDEMMCLQTSLSKLRGALSLLSTDAFALCCVLYSKGG